MSSKSGRKCVSGSGDHASTDSWSGIIPTNTRMCLEDDQIIGGSYYCRTPPWNAAIVPPGKPDRLFPSSSSNSAWDCNYCILIKVTQQIYVVSYFYSTSKELRSSIHSWGYLQPLSRSYAPICRH